MNNNIIEYVPAPKRQRKPYHNNNSKLKTLMRLITEPLKFIWEFIQLSAVAIKRQPIGFIAILTYVVAWGGISTFSGMIAQTVVVDAEVLNTPTIEWKFDKLQAYLEDENSPLAKYSEEIKTLPRWKTALAITGVETHFCRTGNGKSPLFNCGNIKQLNGRWMDYTNPFEGIKDVSGWIERRSAKLGHEITLDEMNGLYCQDEKRAGKECTGWEEGVMYFESQIPE